MGFMCPKWSLEVSRYDVLRQVNVQYEFQLAELLPLAPTKQRSNNLWTTFHAPSREFSVVVQDYPSVGMDTFFQVVINSDVTAASVKVSNVILGHPDASAGDAGRLTLTRIVTDAQGQLLVLFSDGSLHRVDLVNRVYTPVADLVRDTDVKDMQMTSTQVVDTVSNTLKSIVYSPSNDLYYLINTNLDSFSVSAPLTLKPIRNKLGKMSVMAGHMVLEPNSNQRHLSLVYYGSFDWISWVDEATGEQTELIGDLYEASSGSYPCEFQCNAGAKDCDTRWQTTAYDPQANVLYFQTHQIKGDLTTTYIYQVAFRENRVLNKSFPYVEPAVMMTFGYYGYQWVSLA